MPPRARNSLTSRNAALCRRWKPIATTDFIALDRWRDLVSVADGADRFAAAIEAVTGKTVELDERLRRFDGESWDAKADLLARRLAETPDIPMERAA